jgi:O-antigen/teichoic acid export membrane protein
MVPAETVESDILDAPGAGATAARGSILRSAAYAFGLALSLISVPLLIRHLGVADFGTYVTITAIVTIITGVSDIGLTSVGIREWAVRPTGSRRALMADLLGARFVLTLVGCAGGLAFGAAAGYGSVRMAALALACLALVPQALQLALAVPLYANLRQGWVAAGELARQAVQVGLIVTLVLVGAGLVPIMGVAIPAALAGVVVTAWATREALVRPVFHPKAVWRLLHDSLPFASASALGVVYLRATVVVTSLVASAAQTGYFATSFRVIEVLMSVPVLMISAIFPVFARAASADDERFRTAIRSTWETALVVGALATITIAAGAPVAIDVLVGNASSPAVDALRILGLGLGSSFIGATCQFALLARREHRAILAINALAVSLNIALTLGLAPSYGARGAAIALVIGDIVVTVLATALLLRAVPRLRLRVGIALRVACALAAGAVAAIALSPLGTVPEALGGPLAFMAAALAVRAVVPEVWSVLWRQRVGVGSTR